MNIFSRIIKYNIYLLVALVPLFFLPFSFEVLEYNKQYLIFFLVSLVFFAWVAKMALYDREIRFKRTPLDIFVLAFLAAAILSAVFSVDKTSSVYGFYGRFSNGLVGFLSLGVLYFLITNNVDEKRVQGLLKAFLWSSLAVVSVSYLAVFGILARFDFLPDVIQQIIFNPASNSLEGLSIFLAVVLVFLAGMIVFKAKEKAKTKRSLLVFQYVLLIAVLGLLVIIDFTPAWTVILTALVFLVAFSLWKRVFKENVNRLLVPIFLIVVAAFCIPWQSQKVLINLPSEYVLDQNTSWQIGFNTAVDNVESGFFGSGIGTFYYDFTKEKPLSFNQNWLWQIRFNKAGSHLAEILATMGFLGMACFLGLVGIFLFLSYRFNSKHLPLMIVFVALLTGQFVFYQNTVLAFMFWLVLGLSVVSWQKPTKEKVISLKEFPELNLVFSTVVIVFGVAILAAYFYGAKFYLADVSYVQALTLPLGVERTESLQKAVRLNPGLAQYRAILARNYLAEALVEMAKPAEEQDAVQLSNTVTLAINQAKIAVFLAPNQVAHQETLGMIYREIRGIADGAVEWGIRSFETAVTLEPTNPVFNTELGKLYLAIGDFEKAREEFDKALEKKSDYIDALIQKVLITEREGDLAGAISGMEKLASSYPLTEVLFQLGRLYFNNNQTTKAIEQFKQVIILSPDHSNTHYSLGVAYAARGETSLAIEEFEKVLELNPGNRDVIQKLEQLR